MISQYWFRLWLGAVGQQAITWANVDPDLCRHMVSLGHNELTKHHQKHISVENFTANKDMHIYKRFIPNSGVNLLYIFVYTYISNLTEYIMVLNFNMNI